jgi:hypothetical protein
MYGSAVPTGHQTALFSRCIPLSPVYFGQAKRATFEHNLKSHRAPANGISPLQLDNIFALSFSKHMDQSGKAVKQVRRWYLYRLTQLGDVYINFNFILATCFG